jgi:hypothetical protein
MDRQSKIIHLPTQHNINWVDGRAKLVGRAAIAMED